MLTLIDVALRSFDQQLRAAKSGSLPAHRCWRDLERSIGRLHDKIELTDAMRAGFGSFVENAERFIREFDANPRSQKADAAYAAATSQLAALRQSLETATMPYTERNETLGFAERTRINLAFAIRQSQLGEMHVITQLTLSLLGLVVFPVEQLLDRAAANEVVAGNPAWSQWNVTLGEEHSRTLADLSRRVRNAAAHRRIMFSSDSRDLAEVFVEMEDYKPRQAVPFWRGDIRADHLHVFCERFAAYIEDVIG